MPAEIRLAIAISPERGNPLASVGLSEDVWVQFVCQTGEGEHDAEAQPDDRVRPSHAAFHGRVFKLQDAPVPPLDYGCRCAMRYVAAPDSPAVEVLKEEATTEPVTPQEATEDWLRENVGGVDALIKIARTGSQLTVIARLVETLKRKKVADPRIVAEMVVDVAGGR